MKKDDISIAETIASRYPSQAEEATGVMLRMMVDRTASAESTQINQFTDSENKWNQEYSFSDGSKLVVRSGGKTVEITAYDQELDK